MRRALMLILVLLLLVALATPAMATSSTFDKGPVTAIGGDVLAPAGTPADVIAMVASELPTPAPATAGGHLSYDYE